MQLRVLIADDHPIVREGWVQCLSRWPEYEIVAQCANGREAVEAWQRLGPDLGLLDLRMPELDGIGAIAAIVQAEPQARLVVMTTFESEEDIFRALRAGARGYLLKDTPLEQISECLHIVAQGGRYFPGPVAARLSERLHRPGLTERELQCLQQLARGLSNKEIAAELSLSVETVKGYVKSVMAKLDSHSRTEAVHQARLRGHL